MTVRACTDNHLFKDQVLEEGIVHDIFGLAAHIFAIDLTHKFV